MDDPTEFLQEEDKAELKQLGWVEPEPSPPPVQYPYSLSVQRCARRVGIVASPVTLACIPGLVINGFVWWAWLVVVIFVSAAVLLGLSVELSKRRAYERDFIDGWRRLQENIREKKLQLDRLNEYSEELKERHAAIEAQEEKERVAKEKEREAMERAEAALLLAREQDALAADARDKAYMLDQLRPATPEDYKKWFDGFINSGGVPSRRQSGDPENFWTTKYRYLRVRPLHGENALNIIVPTGVNLAFDNTGDHTGDSVLYLVNRGGYRTLRHNDFFQTVDVVHYTGEEE